MKNDNFIFDFDKNLKDNYQNYLDTFIDIIVKNNYMEEVLYKKMLDLYIKMLATLVSQKVGPTDSDIANDEWYDWLYSMVFSNYNKNIFFSDLLNEIEHFYNSYRSEVESQIEEIEENGLFS